MIVLRCIGVCNLNSDILGYILCNSQGIVKIVPADLLKKSMINRECVVTNLFIKDNKILQNSRLPNIGPYELNKSKFKFIEPSEKNIFGAVDVFNDKYGIPKIRGNLDPLNFTLDKSNTNKYMLITLLNSLNTAKVDFRVLECGILYNKKHEAKVFMIFGLKQYPQTFMFSVLIRECETFELITDSSVVDVYNVEDLIDILEDDILVFQRKYKSNIIAEADNSVDYYLSSIKTDESFNENVIDNCEIMIAGNNIVLLGFKKLAEVLTVPDCITIVNNNFLPRNSGVKQINCKGSAYRLVGDVLRSSKDKIFINKI